MSPIVVIPDIHGRWDKFQNLLGTLQFLGYELDNLIILGDFIDRGPEAAWIIDWLIKHKKQYPKTVILRGNHEEMMLHYLRSGDESWFRPNNGGAATLESYRKFLKTDLRTSAQFYQALRRLGHWDFLNDLMLYFETDHYFFSHAPIPKNQYWPRGLKPSAVFPFPEELYCWATPALGKVSEEEFARVHPERYAVCGHVHRLREQIFEARRYRHICYLDAGCGCHPNAPLAALVLPEEKIFYSI